jgi:TPR repeat protein
MCIGYKEEHMNERLRLTSDEIENQPTCRPVRRGVNLRFFCSILAVLAVGAASTVAWYAAEFSTEARASRGEPKALYLLGKRYFDSATSPHDYVRAARLIRAAATQGDAAAETAMGLLLQRGLGVKKDYAEALKWLGRAADQGNPVAQNEVGVMYAKGQGVQRNLGETIKWCGLAAGNGSVIARKNLQMARTLTGEAMSQLTTTMKRSYDRAILREIDSNGVTISFQPTPGGLGLAKLKLAELPSDLQKICKNAAQEGAASKSPYSQLTQVTSAL